MYIAVLSSAVYSITILHTIADTDFVPIFLMVSTIFYNWPLMKLNCFKFACPAIDINASGKRTDLHLDRFTCGIEEEDVV
jgi:hypothetical protein